MPDKGDAGSGSGGHSEWTQAWEAVSRLAANHPPLAPRDTPKDRRFASNDAPALAAPRTDPAAWAEAVAIEPAELALAVAQIEKAAAALRESDPALEIWRPDAGTGGEPRSHLSVWILIGGIWLSTCLLVVGAASAIFYILG